MLIKRTRKSDPRPTPLTKGELDDFATLKAEYFSFAGFLSAQKGYSFFPTFDAQNHFNSGELLEAIATHWQQLDDQLFSRAIDRGQYETAAQKRFLSFDLPFDDEAKARYPNIIGQAQNLRELINPAIIDYAAYINYQLTEGTINGDLACNAMRHLRQCLYRNPDMEAPEALALAKTYIAQENIPYADLLHLDRHIQRACYFVNGERDLDEDDEDDLPTQPLTLSEAQKRDKLVEALREYRDERADQPEPPNRFFLQIISDMIMGLTRGICNSDQVLGLLADCRGEAQNPMHETMLMPPTGMSYNELQRGLMQSSQKRFL